MKISKYVTKYDYLNYYTKQENFWFFTNSEITSILKSKIDILSKGDNLFNEENDDSDEEISFDSLNLYKESKLEKDFIIPNIDYRHDALFKKYIENINNLKNVDDDNPLIIEGKILDQESKSYIIKKYKEDDSFSIIDFDEKKQNIELTEKETKKLILKNKNIIIFQPVFIDYERMIATKCDALVKKGDFIKIIETKGTTTTKKIHFLDILYQKKLTDNIQYLSNFNINFFLCLVRYEKLNKGEVSFIISNSVSLSKNGKSMPTKKILTINEKQNRKLGIDIDEKDGNLLDKTYYINQLLGLENFSDYFIENSNDKINEVFELDNNFNNVIKDLWKHKKEMNAESWPFDIKPNYRDFWNFKNSDFKKELRTIFSLEGYKIFHYSGNIVDQTEKSIKRLSSLSNPLNISESEFKTFLKNRKNFDTNWLTINTNNYFQSLNNKKLINFYNNLKDKKVYFDFETINSSIRAFDKTLPFMQTVTQCSIIKSNNNIDISKWVCNNMMQDPKEISVEWFKNIIDELYEGIDASYVVYNKNFEASRLNEMKDYIQNSEYSKKIDEIIMNLFDLADFFNLDKGLLYIPDLYGFYSIKKVLPLIKKYFPSIFEKANCLDYKTLEIGNGLICQQKTTKRFFNMINDNEWQDIVTKSKIYCENDVRAMIAVELFINEIIRLCK